MRLQLLHFHALFKTWLTFQELTSIVSLRRRCWSQENISENRNIQGNQSKDMLIIKDKDYKEIFFLPPNVGITILICLRFLMTGQANSNHMVIISWSEILKTLLSAVLSVIAQFVCCIFSWLMLEHTSTSYWDWNRRWFKHKTESPGSRWTTWVLLEVEVIFTVVKQLKQLQSW